MAMRSDAEVEVRIRNGQLRERRRELGLSQPKMAKMIGISLGVWGGLECLRDSPVSSHGGWRSAAIKIAEFFGDSPDDLFPLWLYGIRRRVLTKGISEQEAARLLGFGRMPALPDAGIDDQRLGPMIRKAVSMLNEREAKVIRMRFGIDCDSMSLEEVGHEIGVTRARVSQIEAKALRKLKHPARSSIVSGFIDRT